MFHTHSRESNNRAVTIISFVLKSSLYDAYPRPWDYQFYFLIPAASLIHSVESFNHDLNRVCLVHMFSSRFSGNKFLINLQRQFRVRKIFRAQVFAGFANFHFVFKINISKTRNSCSRLLFPMLFHSNAFSLKLLIDRTGC